MSGLSPGAWLGVRQRQWRGRRRARDLLEALAGRGPAWCRPTQFHNSVHNAVAGYWSIATKSTQPMTCLAAHDHSFAAGLLTGGGGSCACRADGAALRLRHAGAVAAGRRSSDRFRVRGALVSAPRGDRRTLARIDVEAEPARAAEETCRAGDRRCALAARQSRRARLAPAGSGLPAGQPIDSAWRCPIRGLRCESRAMLDHAGIAALIPHRRDVPARQRRRHGTADAIRLPAVSHLDARTTRCAAWAGSSTLCGCEYGVAGRGPAWRAAAGGIAQPPGYLARRGTCALRRSGHPAMAAARRGIAGGRLAGGLVLGVPLVPIRRICCKGAVTMR